MPGTIGGMQVHQQVRIPAVDQPLIEGSGFVCLHDHPVTIQVESVGGANSGHDRTQFLVGTAVFSHGVIAIGVVDRHKDQDLIVQQVLLVTEQNIAHQNQRGFLALHFAAVNIALNIDYRLAAGLGFPGRGHRRVGQYHHGHIAPFPGQQQPFAMHQLCFGIQGINHRDNLGQSGGARIVGALRRSDHGGAEHRLFSSRCLAGKQCQDQRCKQGDNRVFHGGSRAEFGSANWPSRKVMQAPGEGKPGSSN